MEEQIEFWDYRKKMDQGLHTQSNKTYEAMTSADSMLNDQNKYDTKADDEAADWALRQGLAEHFKEKTNISIKPRKTQVVYSSSPDVIYKPKRGLKYVQPNWNTTTGGQVVSIN